MKTILYTILLIAASVNVRAQFVTCESMPIAYDESHIQFITSVSSGDSMMVIPIINTSSTDFAYPQAKIIPVSPLPTGTSMYDHNWHVFFSSWNTGVTGYVDFSLRLLLPYRPTILASSYSWSPILLPWLPTPVILPIPYR